MFYCTESRGWIAVEGLNADSEHGRTGFAFGYVVVAAVLCRRFSRSIIDKKETE